MCACVCVPLPGVSAQEKVMKDRVDKPFKVRLPVCVFSPCSKSAGHDHDHRRLGLDHVPITRGKSHHPPDNILAPDSHIYLLKVFKSLLIYNLSELRTREIFSEQRDETGLQLAPRAHEQGDGGIKHQSGGMRRDRKDSDECKLGH